jgi:signal transduction histidine kinase
MIEAANATITSRLGLRTGETLVGRRLSSVMADESVWEEWLTISAPVICRFDLLDNTGRHLPVRAEVHRGGHGKFIEIWLAEDLANEMIARLARLEAALTLTAGTVHDVNNVLTVLSGHLFLLTENARDQPKLCEQARRARNAAARGSTLLRELLTYNREQDGDVGCINPGNHVLALKPLLSRAVRANGAGHELAIRVDGGCASVMASAARFESVVINLVINARDALGTRGRIRIRVQNELVSDDRAARLGLEAGDYVCVTVADNGSGIPAEYLHRVTEPLFSTRRKDRSSGLGLTMVKYFVESSRGALRIQSVEGRGTRVRLWLPSTAKLAETTANMTLPLSTLPGGDEWLLLLSRDGDVRSSMQQILEALGYTVAVAQSAEEADRVLAGGQGPALVISERSAHLLPVERHWFDDLKERYPGLRHIALLQAGSSVVEAAPDADGYLFRPVAVPELARTVRNVLEKS